MKSHTLIVAAALAVAFSGKAFAQTDVNVNPAPPPPATGSTVVVPVEQQPQQAPVAAPQPRTQKVVNEDVEHHNYMGTVALSALMGGVAGALVGGAIYYLGDQTNARNIAFWAAGGVLVGTGVGVVQVAVEENRANTAVSSRGGTADPVPTYRLALMRLNF
jgi:hypothetical protein